MREDMDGPKPVSLSRMNSSELRLDSILNLGRSVSKEQLSTVLTSDKRNVSIENLKRAASMEGLNKYSFGAPTPLGFGSRIPSFSDFQSNIFDGNDILNLDFDQMRDMFQSYRSAHEENETQYAENCMKPVPVCEITEKEFYDSGDDFEIAPATLSPVRVSKKRPSSSAYEQVLYKPPMHSSPVGVGSKKPRISVPIAKFHAPAKQERGMADKHQPVVTVRQAKTKFEPMPDPVEIKEEEDFAAKNEEILEIDVPEPKPSWALPEALVMEASRSGPPKKIGIYTLAERATVLAKFRAKRKLRRYKKVVNYECRKVLANNRPRVKGRFARVTDGQEAQ